MKKYFDRIFFKSALVIAMPIVIQQLVTSLAQLIDNIMVGTINGQAIAGVGAANSILFVLMTSTFGISEGASIFIAQQYGAGKRKKMGNSLAVSFTIITLLALISLSLINVFDEKLLGLYIHGTSSVDAAAMNYGLEYINVLVYGYWLLMMNAVIGSAFRAIGQTKVPMAAGVTAVVTNTCLNFILIPILGVRGAAIATITSRIVESCVLIYQLKFKQTIFDFNFQSFVTLQFEQFVQMIRKMIPLTANEFLWGFGTSTLMALYGARNITDLASIQITYTIADILFAAMGGFGVAVAVLIGQKLGENLFDEAVENSKKLIALAVTVGIFFLVLAQIIAAVIPHLYGNIDPIIQDQSANLLRIIGCIFPVYLITVSFFFMLRAGGDTLGVLIMDAGTMWGISIPVGFVLVFFTDAPIYLIFIGVQTFEVVKMLIGFYRYRKFNWLNNIS